MLLFLEVRFLVALRCRILIAACRRGGSHDAAGPAPSWIKLVVEALFGTVNVFLAAWVADLLFAMTQLVLESMEFWGGLVFLLLWCLESRHWWISAGLWKWRYLVAPTRICLWMMHTNKFIIMIKRCLGSYPSRKRWDLILVLKWGGLEAKIDINVRIVNHLVRLRAT